jgi:hypothetical protein
MLDKKTVSELVRRYVSVMWSQDHLVTVREIESIKNQLMHASNIDLRSELLMVINGTNIFQALGAAQLFLKMFRYDAEAQHAIKLFQNVLQSNERNFHAAAYMLLFTMESIPEDLEAAVKSHLDEPNDIQLLAAVIATEFDGLRSKACAVVGALILDYRNAPYARLVGALRLVRHNLAIKKAWEVIDEVGKLHGDSDLRITCIRALSGIEKKPAPRTIKRLLEWGQQAIDSDAADNLTALIVLLGEIETADESIDAFLLESLRHQFPNFIFAAATALTNRKSPEWIKAQTIVVKEGFASTSVQVRETAALCTLRCFAEVLDDTIPVVVTGLRVERDIEVIELLMRICQKAGFRAFYYAFEQWDDTENLRGWLKLLTLSLLGERAIDEIMKKMASASFEMSSRLLAIVIMSARFGSPEQHAAISRKLNSLERTEKIHVLRAMQNADGQAAFLVQDLLPIIVSDDEELAELATRIIKLIGKPALAYFPDRSAGQPHSRIDKVRETIESASLPKSEAIFAGVREVNVKRWEAAARLIHDSECSSMKSAAQLLAERHPNEKGWSEHSIHRAARELENHLESIWHKQVVLFDSGEKRSTRPTTLTEVGVKVMQLAKEYLDNK